MNRYYVTYTIIKLVEFDDDEIREYGYEGEITDDIRKEYLDNLIADEYDLGIPYDDMEVTKMEVDDNA